MDSPKSGHFFGNPLCELGTFAELGVFKSVSVQFYNPQTNPPQILM
jgi:hypothetical protein